MNRRQRRRVTAKMRAKYIMRMNLPLCMAAALIVYGTSMIISIFIGRLLPARGEVIIIEDLSSLTPLAVAAGLSVLADIAVSPMNMGMFWWLSERSMLRKPRLKDAFFTWITDPKRLLGAIGAKLAYYGIALRDALLFVAAPAGVIMLLGTLLSGSDPIVMMYCNSLMLFLTLIGMILTMIDVLAYRPALYLYSSSPDRGIRTAFRECRSIMAGRKLEFLLIHITMLPWFALEFITSGFAMFYTRPYYDLTVLIYTQYAYKLWLVDTGKLPREQFEFALPGIPRFDSGWLW